GLNKSPYFSSIQSSSNALYPFTPRLIGVTEISREASFRPNALTKVNSGATHSPSVKESPKKKTLLPPLFAGNSVFLNPFLSVSKYMQSASTCFSKFVMSGFAAVATSTNIKPDQTRQL